MTKEIGLILAGDSVIDNRAYVEEGEPDVPEQVANELSSIHWVYPVAWDGGLICNVPAQIDVAYENAKSVPPSHLYISVGGNDALFHQVLTHSQRRTTVADGLDFLSAIRRRFAADYEEMLTDVLDYGLKTIISTIYYPVFPSEDMQRRAVTLLSLFNDVIISLATLNRIPVLDLRWISTEEECYANEIEPSAYGGKRIAKKIIEIIQTHNFEGPSIIYTHKEARFLSEPFVNDDAA